VKKNLARISLGIVVVLLLLTHVADRLRVPFVDSLEAIIYDARLKLTMPRTQNSCCDTRSGASFHTALALYRKQEWNMAEQRIRQLKEIAPANRLHDVFLERIAFLRVNPPGPARDGTFTFQSK
jgi:hypothetical protein